jgi:hypothetical protein
MKCSAHDALKIFMCANELRAIYCSHGVAGQGRAGRGPHLCFALRTDHSGERKQSYDVRSDGPS